MLLPGFRSSQVCNIREIKFKIKAEFSLKILRSNFNLCTENHDIVDFDLFFAVPD